MKFLFKDDKGITFVEVTVTVVLFGLIVTAFFSLFDSGFWSWQRGDEQIERQQNLRIAAADITRAIRQARNLTAGCSATELFFTDRDGKGRRYYLNGSQLQVDVMDQNGNLTGHNPVANYIDKIEFTYNDTYTRVGFKLTSKGIKGKDLSLQSGVEIRVPRP